LPPLSSAAAAGKNPPAYPSAPRFVRSVPLGIDGRPPRPTSRSVFLPPYCAPLPPSVPEFFPRRSGSPGSTSTPLPGRWAPSPLLSASSALLFYQPDLLFLKCAKNIVRYLGATCLHTPNITATARTRAGR